MTKCEAIDLWQHVFNNELKDIDPGNYYCWESIITGFFLALGFFIDETYEMYQECIKRNCF